MKTCFILTTNGNPSATLRVKDDIVLSGDDVLLHIENDPQIAEEQGCECPVEYSPHYAKIINSCAAQQEADVYALLHNDMRFYPGWHEAMIACMEECPEVWTANPYNWPDPPKPQMPWNGTEESYWVGESPLKDEKAAAKYAKDNAKVFSPVGGAPQFFRREFFDELGGFDERFQGYEGYEDIDAVRRICEHGKCAATFHRAVVWHRGMVTQFVHHIPAYQSLNKNIYKIKHGVLWDKDIRAWMSDMRFVMPQGWEFRNEGVVEAGSEGPVNGGSDEPRLESSGGVARPVQGA